jgi:hypothetical protein
MVAALLAIFFIREAFFSLTTCFVFVPGAKVFTDGKPTVGWLHTGGKAQGSDSHPKRFR